jgi:hypothetical protein
MARPSKKQIAELLDQWAALAREITAQEAAMETELAPHRKRFQNAAAAIEEKFSGLKPLRQQAAELHSQIARSLQAGVSEADGSIALAQVTTSEAEAMVSAKAFRQIEPSHFFNLIAERGERFWQCFDVLIGKAEGWLGRERVAELAVTTYKPVVTIRRKNV